ncbi:hypothetical protein [Thalassotalea euphylliae]|uniref:DUF3718 domain-containing protein n=1 Tax=Thalassotalea euphylliae TaxID=1655234 RepID=A0A3E0UIB6_9GAMM|nr:hypothetical protein [Thalassotalea euphylliae]REL35935.1 hypothetical protein DXX92_11690 [Thalassotalea euphylliae]
MKYFTLLILLSITTGLLAAPNDSKLEKVYSHQGYPYKQLISRANEVKLSFTETESNSTVTCRVLVQLNNQLFESAQVSVTQQAFAEKPLASCLDRQQAKKLLAASFE